MMSMRVAADGVRLRVMFGSMLFVPVMRVVRVMSRRVAMDRSVLDRVV
jgi:hypothetical protein